MTQTIHANFQLNYGDFQLNVDLHLPSSGITVLFGSSGSGKTTLLRCIAGLQRAPHGFLAINEQVWQDSAKGLFLPTHRRALGYVFQEASLFSHLTVAENLQFGLKRIGKPAASLALPPILELLGIEHLLKRLPEHLSGGEKQRVAIVRALALNPEILLMDEPLAALDSKRKQEILPFLNRLHQTLKIPVLYVTHSQQEVAQLGDYVVLLEQGKVLAAGTLTETLSRLDLPLTQDRPAAVVWQGKIAEHERDYHLSRADFDGVTLNLPMIEAIIGDAVRVQILADDVSITLEASKTTSILNILPATITGLADDQAGQSLVQLRVGKQVLLAHVTYKSAILLGLQVDMAVYVQIKGTSILN